MSTMFLLYIQCSISKFEHMLLSSVYTAKEQMSFCETHYLYMQSIMHDLSSSTTTSISISVACTVLGLSQSFCLSELAVMACNLHRMLYLKQMQMQMQKQMETSVSKAHSGLMDQQLTDSSQHIEKKHFRPVTAVLVLYSSRN